MSFLGQTALIVGILSFTLSFSVLARNVRNKLYLAFALLAFVISGWALAFFVSLLGGASWAYRLHLIFNLALGPTALLLIREVVRIGDGASRWLLRASWLATGVLTVALAGWQADHVPWVRQVAYFAPAVVVVQILLLMLYEGRGQRGARRPKLPFVGLRNRGWIYVGGLAVLATSLMDHVPALGEFVPALGNLGLAAYLFLLSQAITQQRLLDLSALLVRFVVLLLVAFFLTLVYSVLSAWIADKPGLFFLNSFFVSLMIVMLLDPLRSFVRYLTGRVLLARDRRVADALLRGERRLSLAADLGSWSLAVVQWLEEMVRPEAGAIYVARPDGRRFRRARVFGAGMPEGAGRELRRDHPLVEHALQRRRRGEVPVVLASMLEAEEERTAGRGARQAVGELRESLAALGGDLFIPLLTPADSPEGVTAAGMIVLRGASPPEPWGSSWGLLSVVFPYFESAARALRSLETFAVSRERERLAALGEMSAGLAHEIRNPLGAIRGAAQLLAPGREEDRRFLQVILEEADRLNRVVTQFLDYAKPAPVRRERVELAALLARTVERLRLGLPAGARLELAGEVGREVWVSAAPDQLQQVVMNFVQNALNATEGRVERRVEVGWERSGGEASFWVEDGGRGISREQQDKLFIPFFTTSPGGTGLGLPICQKIVQAHQGRIEVQSEAGQGARFTVALPLDENPV